MLGEVLKSRTLQTTAKLKLNVTKQQLCAIGHVVLQWAHLEGEIIDELFWLYRRSEHKRKKRPKRNARFSEKVTLWLKLARRSYKQHPDLIRSVEKIRDQAIKIKRERDLFAHGTIINGLFFKYHDGQLIDILDEIATPQHLEDLACRISVISSNLMRHSYKLQKRFRKSRD